MMLVDCPLCQKISEKSYDQASEHCAVLDLDGTRVVSLLRHEVSPTSQEAREAWTLMGKPTGVIRDVDIPGHWAIAAVPGEWEVGKSAGHSDEPKKTS